MQTFFMVICPGSVLNNHCLHLGLHNKELVCLPLPHRSDETIRIKMATLAALCFLDGCRFNVAFAQYYIIIAVLYLKYLNCIDSK